METLHLCKLKLIMKNLTNNVFSNFFEYCVSFSWCLNAEATHSYSRLFKTSNWSEDLFVIQIIDCYYILHLLMFYLLRVFYFWVLYSIIILFECRNPFSISESKHIYSSQFNNQQKKFVTYLIYVWMKVLLLILPYKYSY